MYPLYLLTSLNLRRQFSIIFNHRRKGIFAIFSLIFLQKLQIRWRFCFLTFLYLPPEFFLSGLSQVLSLWWEYMYVFLPFNEFWFNNEVCLGSLSFIKVQWCPCPNCFTDDFKFFCFFFSKHSDNRWLWNITSDNCGIGFYRCSCYLRIISDHSNIWSSHSEKNFLPSRVLSFSNKPVCQWFTIMFRTVDLAVLKFLDIILCWSSSLSHNSAPAPWS